MNLDRHTTRRSLSVGPKLRAIDGVESLTMKKQINGFILGMLLAEPSSSPLQPTTVIQQLGLQSYG